MPRGEQDCGGEVAAVTADALLFSRLVLTAALFCASFVVVATIEVNESAEYRQRMMLMAIWIGVMGLVVKP